MNRDNYFQPPDSYVREKPEWTKQTRPTSLIFWPAAGRSRCWNMATASTRSITRAAPSMLLS
jgi:hypothetical protein